MNLIMPLLALLLMVGQVWGADLEKAMLGWTDSSGAHKTGILTLEGCTKKNPLGKQNLKGDPGNYRKGKNCGGTVAGICCRDNPGFPFANATIKDVIAYYGRNQWKAVKGGDIISQYLSFKMTRLAINMGTVTAIRLVEQTINDLNGKAKDFPLKGVMTDELVKSLNDFTAPQPLADGSYSHWRRWCFFAQLKLNALDHYGDLIARNKKLAQFWATWSDDCQHDQ